jgi:hypothetical protein
LVGAGHHLDVSQEPGPAGADLIANARDPSA